jgi:hypothetical protein
VALTGRTRGDEVAGDVAAVRELAGGAAQAMFVGDDSGGPSVGEEADGTRPVDAVWEVAAASSCPPWNGVEERLEMLRRRRAPAKKLLSLAARFGEQGGGKEGVGRTL